MKICEMSFNELLVKRDEIKIKLTKCPNTMAYRDTKKYYDKICQEIKKRLIRGN